MPESTWHGDECDAMLQSTMGSWDYWGSCSKAKPSSESSSAKDSPILITKGNYGPSSDVGKSFIATDLVPNGDNDAFAWNVRDVSGEKGEAYDIVSVK